MIGRQACCVAIALLMSACTAPEQESQPPGGAAAVLQVAVGEQVQAAPPNEAFAIAFSKAMELAQANADDMGYPWFDPRTGELVVSAATQRGRELLDAAPIDVPHRIRDVAHSLRELERIKEEVTHLRSQGVPRAELIYEVRPDHRDNRIVIVIKATNGPLIDALAARFPPDTLAVEVSPTGS